MKKILIMCACVFPLLVANDATARGRNSPWYLGFKGGLMDGGNGIADDAANVGFDLGYRHNRYLSTEIEYTDTVVNGETVTGNDWEVSTLSAFAALRSNTPIKVKGKLGITDIDRKNGNDDLEFSFGVGLGFWAAGGLMEIEYTEMSDNLNYLSLGINFFY